jgi:hypothetical protein
MFLPNTNHKCASLLTHFTLILLVVVTLFSCKKEDNQQTIITPPLAVTDVKLSPSGLNYQDIEIDNTRKRAVYLRENREIWMGDLNPANGNFLSANGQNYLMATNAAAADFNNLNGPEFGANATNWGVYYTKQNVAVNQLWRSTLSGNAGVETPLTSGILLRSGVLASTNTQLANTRLIYIRKADSKIMWLNENTPTIENEIPGAVAGVSGPRTLPNSSDIVFCNSNGQIVLLNTTTNSPVVITNDAGVKTDAFGWNAPEYGGALLIFAIVDQTSVAIYKNNGGTYWEKIKNITVDPSSNHPYVYSVEPFVAVGGTKSYLSLHQQKDKVTPPLQTDASIWVWGLDGTRKRCDNGTVARRLDPEFFYGNNQVYLLYNIVVPGNTSNTWEAWSCSTGILP